MRNANGGSATGVHFVLLTDGADSKGNEKEKERKLNESFASSRTESFFIDTILLADKADGMLAVADGSVQLSAKRRKLSFPTSHFVPS